MDLPSLRHFRNTGIYSDPVEALAGEAWVLAVYTDKGWATADGASLLTGIQEWRHAKEDDGSPKESGQGDVGVQSRNTQKRQARPRQGAKGQKPETGNRNCPI